MNKKMMFALCLAALMLLTFGVGIASAHTTVKSGPYAIEIGWVSEPPIIGQMNAIVVNVSNLSSSGASTPSQDSVSDLVVTISYGGQSKILTLQPLGEDTTGQYVAPILPTIPGLYTVDVTGKLRNTDVKVEVQPQEVQDTDTVQFPNLAASQPQQGAGLGLAGWLAIAALVIGLAGLVLAVLAWNKTR